MDDDFLENLPDDPMRPPAPRDVRAAPAAGRAGPGLFPQIEAAMRGGGRALPDNWRPGQLVFYVVDAPQTLSSGQLTVAVSARERKLDGTMGRLKPFTVRRDQLQLLPEGEDRRLLSLFLGARRSGGFDTYGSTSTFALDYEQGAMFFPVACATGRCLLKHPHRDTDPLSIRWDGPGAYEFWLVVDGREGGDARIRGELRRGDERIGLDAPVMLYAGGWVFFEDRIAPLDDHGSFAWISLLRQQHELRVRPSDRGRLVGDMLRLPRQPRLELPEDLRFEETVGTPRIRLMIRSERNHGWVSPQLKAELSFEYAGAVVRHEDPEAGVFERAARVFIRRNAAAEAGALVLLDRLGFRYRPGYYFGRESSFELAPGRLPHAVRDLTAAGWLVEAEGKVYRRSGGFALSVTTGIDWFDLEGGFKFDDVVVSLPKLLQSLRRGEKFVALDDGTMGVLPEDWLKRYGSLAGLGRVEGDALRFTRAQTGFLDALLASQPEVTTDEAFARAREELNGFERILPGEPAAGFCGTLRGYQKDGLGWFDFLRHFGFGGCLADDMGLGKTVQVLALIQARCATPASGTGKDRLPSLVVVPRSLVFNWKVEAGRFVPDLRVLDHTGPDRRREKKRLGGFDVVLTTYGTLRRDAGFFKDVTFDYVVLDEAQAIKNASSDTAKAARLLKGGHRLALSGTPIENHLSELWSLLEFLNPGMMGASPLNAFGGAPSREPDEAARQLLARALRRTKDQVEKDLPPKHEQVLYCELEAEQRKLYDELRDHYRASLLPAVAGAGLGRMKIQILEALLRLRQAAIHPGLIDKGRTGEPSAKLDMLVPQVGEVIEEGHKALVFSQFTSMLAIVRDRFDRAGIRYEYLDGRTKDRQSRVESFQNDAACGVFLISLKAGGLGLNLTAADYVYLLDPWWNPAVEAQAVDRTHRIGQTRQVFTYRLIARDTVEEKIRELQKSKKDLAASIITADNSLIRTLTRNDLELLLS